MILLCDLQLLQKNNPHKKWFVILISMPKLNILFHWLCTPIAKFMRPTWGPSQSCRPHEPCFQEFTIFSIPMVMYFHHLTTHRAYSMLQIKPKSYICLTHLPLDKIDAILQTIFSDAFSWMKSFIFWLIKIKISLKFVPKGPIDNNPTLV